MLRKSGGDFNLRQILQRDFHIAAFEFAVHHLVDVRFGIVHAYGFARKSEHVAMFGGDDGDPDVDVRQETKIVVVDRAGDLAYIARAVKLDGRRNGADGAVPDAAGHGVPGDFDFLSETRRPISGSSTKLRTSIFERSPSCSRRSPICT